MTPITPAPSHPADSGLLTAPDPPPTGPLWLTRLSLNTRHRDTARDLRDTTGLHRRIMSLLPDSIGDHARATTATLWRLDDTHAGPILLIQTNTTVDLGKLPTGWAHTAASRDLAAALTGLRGGQPIRYRIHANPTRRDNATRKLIPLHGPAALEWWARRAPEAGLNLTTEPTLTPQPTTNGKASNGHNINHAITRFDGTATITTPSQLTTAIRTGIGRGRSYGCGLLSLSN